MPPTLWAVFSIYNTTPAHIFSGNLNLNWPAYITRYSLFHRPAGNIQISDIIFLTSLTRFTYEIAPVFTLMEDVVLSKMREHIGWPVGTGDGIFAPGYFIFNISIRSPDNKHQTSQGHRTFKMVDETLLLNFWAETRLEYIPIKLGWRDWDIRVWRLRWDRNFWSKMIPSKTCFIIIWDRDISSVVQILEINVGTYFACSYNFLSGRSRVCVMFFFFRAKLEKCVRRALTLTEIIIIIIILLDLLARFRPRTINKLILLH